MEEKILMLRLHEESLHGLGLKHGVYCQSVLLQHIHKESHVLLHVFNDIPHDSPLQALVIQSNLHLFQWNHEVFLAPVQGVGNPLEKPLT
jgi:hypothetical protein